ALHVIAYRRNRLGAILEIDVSDADIRRNARRRVVIEHDCGPTRVPEYRSSHRCIHAWPISADGRPLNACIDAVAAAENIATLEQHSPVWAECRGECAAYIRLPQDGSAYRTAARARHRHSRSRNTGRRRAREPIGPTWRLSGHTQVAARRVRPIEGRHR